MATSTIKADSSNAPITGVADTTVATANRTDLSNRLVREGNIVHIDLSILFNTVIPTGNFALIPSAFRPKETVRVFAVWRNSSGAVTPYNVTIKPNGYIEQQIGSNTANISISATYTV